LSDHESTGPDRDG